MRGLLLKELDLAGRPYMGSSVARTASFDTLQHC